MKKLLLSLLVASSFTAIQAQTTCATALTLSTSGATTTSPTYTTSTFSGGCLGSRTGIKAIWYKFTPTANGEVTLSSNLTANNGTTYTNDTRVSVFEGSCTALSCIGANDDVSGTNYLSSITVSVAAGTTYYVQWDNYWGLDNASTTTQNLGFKFTYTFNAVSCVTPGGYDFYLPDTYTTTSARLIWDPSIGTPANYDVDWSTTATAAAGTGTQVTFPAGTLAYVPAIVTGIPASSNFRYFVRSKCGASSQSSWQGPFTGYLAKTLSSTQGYTTTFDDATLNYTDGFVGSNGFARLTTDATTTPASYADGGNGSAMYTANSTTAAANTWGYSRAFSLQAGQVVNLTFKTRLYTTSTTLPASAMSIRVTAGTAQSSTTQTTVLTTVSETSAAAYTSRSATFTAPSAGVYYFGFNNNSAIGAAQTFLFLDTLGFTSTLATDQFDALEISVYPNPANDLVTISNTTNAIISNVEMTDLNGRIVKNTSLNATEGQINISDLSTGVYLMKVSSDQGSTTKKIIKN